MIHVPIHKLYKKVNIRWQDSAQASSHPVSRTYGCREVCAAQVLPMWVAPFVLRYHSKGKTFGLAITRSQGEILLEVTLRNNLGQVVYTYVPLSPSSITCYRPKGGDAADILRYISAFDRKRCKISDPPRVQNLYLLFIVYDHINTICGIIQRLFWAQQTFFVSCCIR